MGWTNAPTEILALISDKTCKLMLGLNRRVQARPCSILRKHLGAEKKEGQENVFSSELHFPLVGSDFRETSDSFN